MIYPWLNEIWSQLLERRRAPPHALLITGRQGLGKQELAETFSKAMLCRAPAPDGSACGRCEACHWFAQGTHPDFRLIAPEADDPAEDGRPAGARASRTIRIHQVRALQDWLAVGAHQSGWRLAVIVPAEAMTVSTANALLKTLEEPPPASVLLLVCHQPSRLLPTVRSRCQQIVCPVPPRATGEAWLRAQGIDEPALRLALSSGAPLTARDFGEQEEMARVFREVMASRPFSVFRAAARMAAFPIAAVIDLMQRWVHDGYCASLGLAPRVFAANDFAPAAPAGPASAQPASSSGPSTAVQSRRRRLLEMDRRLLEARRLADHPLNARLVLEELLADLGEAVAGH
jgi:DNA polymerase-3 subunit delta'